MIKRGFDALYQLDRARVGRMIDRPDGGGYCADPWQILDEGRWIADVSAKAAELLIAERLVEDVADPDMDEPIYRISHRGWVMLYATLPHTQPAALEPAPVEPPALDGPTRMMRRLCAKRQNLDQSRDDVARLDGLRPARSEAA